MKSLAEVVLGSTAIVERIEGPRGFRRRLMEIGLLPGAEVTPVRVAPLGDPIVLELHGGTWSIRRAEAAQIAVQLKAPTRAPSRTQGQ